MSQAGPRMSGLDDGSMSENDPHPAKLNASVCPAPFESFSLPGPPKIKVEGRRQKSNPRSVQYMPSQH